MLKNHIDALGFGEHGRKGDTESSRQEPHYSVAANAALHDSICMLANSIAVNAALHGNNIPNNKDLDSTNQTITNDVSSGEINEDSTIRNSSDDLDSTILDTALPDDPSINDLENTPKIYDDLYEDTICRKKVCWFNLCSL